MGRVRQLGCIVVARVHWSAGFSSPLVGWSPYPSVAERQHGGRGLL